MNLDGRSSFKFTTRFVSLLVYINALCEYYFKVIVEGPKESMEEAMQIVRNVMEDPLPPKHKLLVDLTVDAKSADTWYLAK